MKRNILFTGLIIMVLSPFAVARDSNIRLFMEPNMFPSIEFPVDSFPFRSDVKTEGYIQDLVFFERELLGIVNTIEQIADTFDIKLQKYRILAKEAGILSYFDERVREWEMYEFYDMLDNTNGVDFYEPIDIQAKQDISSWIHGYYNIFICRFTSGPMTGSEISEITIDDKKIIDFEHKQKIRNSTVSRIPFDYFDNVFRNILYNYSEESYYNNNTTNIEKLHLSNNELVNDTLIFKTNVQFETYSTVLAFLYYDFYVKYEKVKQINNTIEECIEKYRAIAKKKDILSYFDKKVSEWLLDREGFLPSILKIENSDLNIAGLRILFEDENKDMVSSFDEKTSYNITVASTLPFSSYDEKFKAIIEESILAKDLEKNKKKENNYSNKLLEESDLFFNESEVNFDKEEFKKALLELLKE